MKKLMAIAMALLIICTLTVNVLGATDAFKTIVVDKNITYIDDATTQDKGGSGNPIQYVEGYGCGYSSLNDIVVFKDLDFGKNGAKACSMKFGYAGSSETTLSVFIDDYKGTPAAKLAIKNTGGWDIKSVTKNTDFDIKVPGGVHTIYFQFTNDQSGSISELVFIEGDPVVETTTAAPAATKPAAPQTFDILSVISVAAVTSAASLAVISKKKK